MFKKTSSPQFNDRIIENRVADFNRNNDYIQANTRDVTSAVVDFRGAMLVNEYWGVSLEVPPGAIPEGVKQELYFVITDPRTCQNAPPLDLENGIKFILLLHFIISPTVLLVVQQFFGQLNQYFNHVRN